MYRKRWLSCTWAMRSVRSVHAVRVCCCSITHRFLLKKKVQPEWRCVIQTPLQVNLRTQPPVGDEDFLLGCPEDVAHGRHEGPTVHEPKGLLFQISQALLGAGQLNNKSSSIAYLIESHWSKCVVAVRLNEAFGCRNTIEKEKTDNHLSLTATMNQSNLKTEGRILQIAKNYVQSFKDSAWSTDECAGGWGLI